MRCARFVVALALAGCVTEHGIELSVRSAVPLPPEVASWELRVSRLDGDGRCPSAEQAASARPSGRLAQVQSFEAEGMAVGEVPRGRWAFAAIARDEACAVLLYGCTEIDIGPGVASPIVVDVDEVATTETCGCRACVAGRCDPPAAVCD